MIFNSPLDGPHLGEPGHLEGVRSPSKAPPADHRLPNGHWCFRVTQTFASTTGYYQGVAHGALDLGNYKCGDRVLAPAGGLAKTGVDGAGALYVIIDHENGWKSLLWHLDGWTIPQGVWVRVAQGQQVGIVGDTGLGAVCHLHWEVHFSGVKRDPWPLLAQNQEVAVLPAGGYFVEAEVGPGVRLRTKNSTTDGSLVTEVATAVRVLGIIRGGVSYSVSANGKTVSDNDWYVVATADGRVWETAKLLVHKIVPTAYLFSQVPLPAADTTALENKINRGITAFEGIERSATALLTALRSAIKALKE